MNEQFNTQSLYTSSEPVLDNMLVLIQPCGSGNFADVYLARFKNDKNNDNLCVVKILKDKADEGDTSKYKNFKREQESLKKLNHQNIVNLLFYQENGVLDKGYEKINVSYLCFEYLEHGNLSEFLSLYSFSEPILKGVIKHLLFALQICKENNISHRDIKLENVLFDKNWIVKLADFGFASTNSVTTSKLKTKIGTRIYCSPELNIGLDYNGEKNDIFSLGILTFACATKKYPFELGKIFDPINDLHNMHVELLTDPFYLWVKYPGLNASDGLKNFISNLLWYDPNKRYSIQDALNDKWINSDLPTDDQYFKFFKINEVLRIKRELKLNERLQENQYDNRVYKSAKYKVDTGDINLEDLSVIKEYSRDKILNNMNLIIYIDNPLVLFELLIDYLQNNSTTGDLKYTSPIINPQYDDLSIEYKFWYHRTQANDDENADIELVFEVRKISDDKYNCEIKTITGSKFEVIGLFNGLRSFLFSSFENDSDEDEDKPKTQEFKLIEYGYNGI